MRVSSNVLVWWMAGCRAFWRNIPGMLHCERRGIFSERNKFQCQGSLSFNLQGSLLSTGRNVVLLTRYSCRVGRELSSTRWIALGPGKELLRPWGLLDYYVAFVLSVGAGNRETDNNNSLGHKSIPREVEQPMPPLNEGNGIILEGQRERGREGEIAVDIRSDDEE